MAENSAEILEQLKGIHLPPAPPEPALWPLVVASVLISLAAVVALYRYKRKTRWHHHALQELARIEHLQKDKQLYEVAKLLKRVAITHDKTTDTTRLTGQAWLDYLDQFYNTSYFSAGDGRILSTNIYGKPDNDTSPKKMISQVKRLIKHRVWFGV